MKVLNRILIALLIVPMASSLTSQVNLIKNSDMFLQQSRFQEALDVLNTHIEYNPDDAKAYLKRASVHAMLGQSVREEDDLKYAQLLNPHVLMYADASNRSRGYVKKQYDYRFGDSQDKSFVKSPIREEYYIKYLDQHIEDDLLKLQLLDIIYFLSIKDLQTAQSQLIAVESKQDVGGILHDVNGLLALKKDKLEESIYHFTNAINELPSYPLAYHNRAVAYTLMGDYERAVRDLDSAISIDSDISLFYFSKALINENIGAYKRAKEDYEEAISLNPHYVEAQTNHSLVMKSLGDYEESTTRLLQILNENTNTSKDRFIKGGIHLTFGEYSEAITAFDRYLSINPADPAALFNRGLAKILSGDNSKGCEDIALSNAVESSSDKQSVYESFCNDW